MDERRNLIAIKIHWCRSEKLKLLEGCQVVALESTLEAIELVFG